MQRCCKKRYRTGNVALEESDRIAYGLADFDETGKMNNCRGFVVGDDLVKSFPIAHVALLERAPLHKFPVPIDQAVKDDGRISLL